MPVVVSIPTLLRTFTQDQKRVEAQGATVLEVLDHLDSQYPGIKQRLMSGEVLHRFVNVYVNEDDIRFAEGLSTRLKQNDVLTILPAVAGGC
ncbi:MoaD/ThiS family protein [Pseudomonas sp. MAFF 302030]|uniref:MoaD/ThiS family protein n=1 Tax=Pseudomonas morbosilactucae TaxID=2938197 RepID=A0A9X1YTZ8_9PSED|nr:MoaD/ThiS family protein [Pseudomonas morbosilactucae]MCK9798087.1 MoaD/ThiS family protein [Pseudomonas morbosilactucae]